MGSGFMFRMETAGKNDLGKRGRLDMGEWERFFMSEE